mmetsp:Transcript_19859/g.31554  ORF Transcript_19859/g.31554 Transcript_19859/m.31554 type:complete len:133 (-) Transcript_19859:681-1079(-)
MVDEFEDDDGESATSLQAPDDDVVFANVHVCVRRVLAESKKVRQCWHRKAVRFDESDDRSDDGAEDEEEEEEAVAAKSSSFGFAEVVPLVAIEDGVGNNSTACRLRDPTWDFAGLGQVRLARASAGEGNVVG